MSEKIVARAVSACDDDQWRGVSSRIHVLAVGLLASLAARRPNDRVPQANPYCEPRALARAKYSSGGSLGKRSIHSVAKAGNADLRDGSRNKPSWPLKAVRASASLSSTRATPNTEVTSFCCRSLAQAKESRTRSPCEETHR